MLRLYRVVEKIAPTDSTVLITGESGTGKEVLAHFIHDQSRRAAEKFVAVNCSALPESLLESELFGHTKGAFTGAVSDKIGLLKEADRGTFFFDEIAELPPAMQTKLLRFLQDHEIRPTGSVRSEAVDVRVLAATSRNLAHAVNDGRFREDLFYRLNVIHLHLPRLDDRKDDLPLFVDHFIENYNAKEKRQILGADPESLNFLAARSWPGNIRQLKNVVERGLIFTEDGERLSTRAFSFLPGTQEPASDPLETANRVSFKKARERALQEFTAAYLRELLKRFEGNVTAAADAAGLGRQSFHRLLKSCRIRAQDFRITA